MNGEEFNRAKAILRKEYPNLHAVEIERIAKTCHKAKWFQELRKRTPRSVGLTQGLNAANVEKIEGEGTEPEEQADNLGKAEAEKTKDSAPDDLESDHLEIDALEEAKSELAEQREAQIRGMELLAELLLSTHVTRVQHMRCSIGLALLKGSLSAAEVANHFGVSDETVRVQTKKVEETIKSLARKPLNRRNLVHNS